jgi:2-polyprenyl-3-methyl-5-hydroxy-6-metoxy-1,4-benzoquinol methylase
MTESYYDDERGLKFAESTASLEMTSLYKPFLARIPKGGHILDVGCGSGRDTKNFLQMGYKVTAFDASPQMVAFASKLAKHPVMQMTFDDVNFVDEFDGVWACASLLHVAKADLNSVLVRLVHALKPGGVMYMSFKHGVEEQVRNGRRFSDFTEGTVRALIAGLSKLEVEELWETGDLRPGREVEHWMNIIAGKKF